MEADKAANTHWNRQQTTRKQQQPAPSPASGQQSKQDDECLELMSRALIPKQETPPIINNPEYQKERIYSRETVTKHHIRIGQNRPIYHNLNIIRFLNIEEKPSLSRGEKVYTCSCVWTRMQLII
ncbi:uncharacterized protein LOC119951981 isoform X2 [Scyliorhinus canicula]|uniref:uncharacterized protein LOC119951981 isoform X2 n=1 Tax=Scyliorhinus canicula TaxID=7830 RepID=UPI0018F5A345|nr:uncharacterized protein LOC119951981 isoform X2 [Scyliorhinus canicula]